MASSSAITEITNAMPETEITIEADEKNRVVIRTTFGNYDISGSAPEDFPKRMGVFALDFFCLLLKHDTHILEGKSS